MKSVKRAYLCTFAVVLSMSLSLSSLSVMAAPGDNLYISGSQWGQLIDATGSPVEAKGDVITIPVPITSAQGTILVTTPGAGSTHDEKSMPEFNVTTGTYKNVVYIDQVSAPAGGVYEYTFEVDSASVTKGQTLYVKVGGTAQPVGDNQKATTTYLGAVMPGSLGDYSAAANGEGDLVITTPSAVWTNPKVIITISEGGLTKEISTDITVSANSVTVSNDALQAAFEEVLSGSITITGIKLSDTVIEDIELTGQSIVIDLSSVPAAPAVTADDVANTIVGLDTATMEYAISTDGGATFGSYASTPAPALGGSKVVRVRIKAAGQTPAGADTVLNFTPNYGDVDGDGVINISDVIMTAEIAVGTAGYTSEQRIRANVSHKTDMTIDISDLVLILERVAGGSVAFPVDLP